MKIFQKTIISLILFSLLFLFFTPFVNSKVKAQTPVTDPVANALKGKHIAIEAEESADRKVHWIKEAWDFLRDKVIIRAGKIAYKNALRTFLSRLAYDTATKLAEGDVGQSPLFNVKNMGDFLDDVYQTTLVDTLDILASDNGFFEFNVCTPPDLNLRFAIHYSLFQERAGRGAARCTLDELNQSWTDWAGNIGQTYSNEQFLDTLRDSFKPQQSDVGVYLTLDQSIRSRIKDEETKQLFDRLANQNFKAVTEPISGLIKTPAAVSEQYARELASDAPISEDVPTGDIVADSIGIFTNTLAAKLMKKLLDDGLSSGRSTQGDIAFRFVSQQAGLSVADQFASLAEVSYTSGQERILEKLTQCPNSPCADDPTKQCPGPTDCVIPSRLVTAIEQRYTIKEALDRGNLDGNLIIGFNADGSQPDYRQGYPYRSLVIMRQHRIIPVGWELAALYSKNFGSSQTLSDLVHCFEDPSNPNDNSLPEDCRNGDINPYYHLVDPNWVLKSPESWCARKGYGYQIISSEYACLEDNVEETMDAQNNEIEGPACELDLIKPDKPVLLVNRDNEYCADWQTCLKEDDDGNCQGVYGYCLEEKPIWRFNGDSCSDYYNSCETFARADDKQFTYLRDTLQECPSVNDAGCWRYSTYQDKTPSDESQLLEWNSDYKVYLNSKAASCQPNGAGCSQLSRMLPGINTAFNGSFELNIDSDTDWPDDWKRVSWEGNDPECLFSMAENEGYQNSSALKIEVTEDDTKCGAMTNGFIPINWNYSYSLGGHLKSSGGDQRTDVCLRYYDNNKDYIAGSIRCDILDEDNNTSLWPSTSWEVYSGEVTGIPANAKYAVIKINGPRTTDGSGETGTVWYDNIQLAVTGSPVVAHNLDNFNFDPNNYQQDYSQDDNYARQFIRVAPEYLACEGYNDLLLDYSEANKADCFADGHYWRSDINFCVQSGDALCQNYATFCKANEIGCQGYTPLTGGPEISAKVTQDNVCPVECVGYDSYLQLNTFFEKVEDPDVDPFYQNFIPQTAQECPVQDAGCEQFTNLDEVAQGGEGIEYFTYLRQCISPNNSNIQSYFTWEGSDTSGYQLKKWNLLASNIDIGPCTNIEIGTEECQDTLETQASCTALEAETDPNCREFFDTDGDIFWRLQDRTITASGDCRPYRRTATGEIYNADPAEGISCSATFNGCREYRGNNGNNIRNVIFSNFESGISEGWENTEEGSLGIIVSNESVYQGGHSLRGFVSNDTIINNLINQISSGKEYVLSFWAKKGNVPGGTKADVEDLFEVEPVTLSTPFQKLASLFGQKAQAADPTDTTLLNFELDGLTSEWRLYNLGPVELDDVGTYGQTRLIINGLDGNEAFFVDNITLKEYTNNFYVIENSWQTPNSCDTPSDGAQLGCQQYLDRQNQIYNLKSFDFICSSTSIGCEAYLTTQNSTNYQSEKVYDNGFGGQGICNNTVGQIDADGDCIIRGEVKCNVGGGDSCNYEVAKVPNDEILYLVNDPDKQCSGSNQGCQRLGKPSFNRQLEDYTDENFIDGYGTVNLINNPDNYGSSLCSESSLFCTSFTGELTGQSAYFDPVGAGGEEESRTCYFSGNRWLRTGTDEPCYDDKFLPIEGQYNYEGWVGVCPASESTCTEYLDPEQPMFESAEICDSSISSNLTGICEDISNSYCRVEINGIQHKVCREEGNDFNTLGCTQAAPGEDIYYSAYDWYCDIGDPAVGPDGEDCCIGPSGDNRCSTHPDADAVRACSVQEGDEYCIYNSVCEPYYYLNNTLEVGEACKDGVVDREAGCLLFNDTSNNSLDWSSQATADGNTPANCDTEAPFTSNSYCDSNKYYSVVKDRECSEWLQCGGAIQVSEGEYSCLDLVRCKGLNPENSSECADLVPPTSAPEVQTFDFGTEVDKTRYLSGYSHVGLDWGDGNVIEGYYSPENMQQVGHKVKVDNGSFENFSGDLDSSPNIKNWLANWADSEGINGFYTTRDYCSYSLDTNKVLAGQYSLSITLREEDPDNDQTICPFSSRGGNDNGFYFIDPDSYYSLIHYSLSSNSQIRGAAGLTWFDGNFNQCKDGVSAGSPGYCGISSGGSNVRGIYCNPTSNKCSTSPSHPTSASDWQKGIITFGPEGESHSFKEIPPDAKYVRIDLRNLENDTYPFKGTIWYDNILLEPVLEVNESTLVGKDCRLFPREDSPSCSYQTNQLFNGWNGYCLEPDPYYQNNVSSPDNWQNCLQWYPVDSLSGDMSSIFNIADIGYQDRRPLYYCLQSQGRANYSDNYSDVCQEIPSDVGENGYCGYKWATNIKMAWHDRFSDIVVSVPSHSIFFSDSSPEELWSLNYSEIQAINVLTTFDDSEECYPQFETIYSLLYEPVGNYYYFNWKCMGDGWGRQEGSYGEEGPSGGTRVRVNFDDFGNIETVAYGAADGDNQDDDWGFRLIFYLKDVCTEIVQVVNEEGEEKAWLDRFNYGWSYGSGNELGLTKNMPASVLNSSPYGSFVQPENELPNSWNPSILPLSVFQGGSYNKYYAGFPISTQDTMTIPAATAGRTCISGPALGNECLESDIGDGEDLINDCSTNIEAGICSGIGKFCYNSFNNLTNGQPCSTNNDCVEEAYGTCRGLGNENEEDPNFVLGELQMPIYSGSRGNPGQQDALERIQNLFAKIYGVWQWDGSSYELCNPWPDGTEDCGIASLDQMDISDDPDISTPPAITDLRVDGASDLKAPGGLVYLNFTSSVDPDQMPIEQIYIEWGDETGGIGDLEYGPFIQGNHSFYNYYTCITNTKGDRCIECPGGSLVGDDCVFDAPAVNLVDHWGWCASGDHDNCVTSNLISTGEEIRIRPKD